MHRFIRTDLVQQFVVAPVSDMSSVSGGDDDLLDQLVEKNREEATNFKRLTLYNQHSTKSGDAATTKLFLTRLHNIRSVRLRFV